MAEKAILFDASHCTGCKACQVACKCWNLQPSPTGLNESRENWTSSYQNPPDLAGNTRLVMTFNETDSPTKIVGLAIGRRSCMHCTNAPCAQVCPSGALERNGETGMVEVDARKCIGCHYCSSACPYDVPHYYGDKGVINKCTGCPDRIANGLEPACVKTCQPDALHFGDRDEMIEKAHERVEFLHEHGYEDAFVYGEDQVGGAHVIEVLKYGIENYELPENPTVSPTVPMTQIMKPLTAAAGGVAVAAFAVMFGLAHGYKRDTLYYNEETGDTISLETGEVVQHGDPQDDMSVLEHVTGNLPEGVKSKLPAKLVVTPDGESEDAGEYGGSGDAGEYGGPGGDGAPGGDAGEGDSDE